MAHDATSEPEEWSDTDLDDASDTEVGDALDWLDAVEGPDGSAQPSAAWLLKRRENVVFTTFTR